MTGMRLDEKGLSSPLLKSRLNQPPCRFSRWLSATIARRQPTHKHPARSTTAHASGPPKKNSPSTRRRPRPTDSLPIPRFATSRLEIAMRTECRQTPQEWKKPQLQPFPPSREILRPVRKATKTPNLTLPIKRQGSMPAKEAYGFVLQSHSPAARPSASPKSQRH